MTSHFRSLTFCLGLEDRFFWCYDVLLGELFSFRGKFLTPLFGKDLRFFLKVLKTLLSEHESFFFCVELRDAIFCIVNGAAIIFDPLTFLHIDLLSSLRINVYGVFLSHIPHWIGDRISHSH